ncbi:EamA family transporter RarD [Arenibaculum sp.]|jgi:chloramphenicol-sensitive protein RarD|uniref:EamA family transporter RarD n=1 Tax=Arenibaculum sp. TaxID=2865862 RepID=UPI002E0EE1BA|nr:EamA family transporter RarD [Arenibaculum sp.]
MSKALPSSTGTGPWRNTTVTGLLYAFGAFFTWGLSPIYFKALVDVPATEIMAHRVVWSALLMIVVVLALRSRHAVAAAFATRRQLGFYAVTTLLVSTNWLLFIWAVNTGHMVQVSLGYYINPLVNVVLGVLFLHERLEGRQKLAVALAVLGVASLVAAAGTLPWISLTLALSFGFYALMRKKAGIDPLIGLLAETLMITPLAIGYLVWADLSGWGSFGSAGLGLDALLAAAGAVTAVPLILFMYGAQRLKLSTIGLMQYLAPTIQLLLGVALYGEAFTTAHALAFGFIWTGLAVYSSQAFRSR